MVVRINDRGPFHGNRVMDVSRAAANKLGFLSSGTAKIRIEPLKTGKVVEKDQVVEAKKSQSIYADLKTFDNQQDAQAFLEQTSQSLQKAKLSQKAIMVKQKSGYVVRVGPFVEQKHADEYQQQHKQEVI